MPEEIKINPEEFAKQFISGQGPVEEPPQDPQPPTPPGEPQPVDENLDPYWKPFYENFKDREGFAIPEEIKTGKDKDGNDIPPEVKAKILFETVTKFSQPADPIEGIEDPFVKNYIQASKKEGFNRDEFIKSEMAMAQLINAPADKFLTEVYKQESKAKNFGWTDDDIKKHIDSMTPIARQREADAIRANLREQQLQAAYSLADQRSRELESKILPKVNEEQIVLNNKFISEIKTSQSIGGFRFEEAERDQFISEIPEFTKKKIVKYNDGSSDLMSDAEIVLEELLGNPESSMQLLPYLWLVKQGKIKGYSSDLVEKEKKKVIERLNREPERQRGIVADDTFDSGDFIRGGK